MRARFVAINVVAIGGAILLAGCSPRYNWREVRLEEAPLTALLPCKPDRATRPVAFEAGTLTLHMQGCEAGVATFTLASAEVGNAAKLASTLDLWQRSTLARMRAATSQRTPFVLGGASPLVAPFLVTGSGSAPDGSPVSVRAAYFARGTQVFQAAIYAKGTPASLQEDVSDSFFSGLRLP